MAETIGQTVDAELAVVKARLAVLEAKASTDWAKVKAAVKANVPHYVTWAALGASLAHQFGWLKL
jgi:hypothetical protein